MSSLNKVILLGRLGKDPELRYTQSQIPCANFSMATSERWRDSSGETKENTEWHQVVCWQKTAENVNKYCRKGDLVLVEGKLYTETWTDKQGEKRYSTKIRANAINFLTPKGGNQSAVSEDIPGGPLPKNQSDNQYDNTQHVASDGLDDIPF